MFWIPASAADVAAVNPDGTNTLLANGVVHFSLMINQLSLMVWENWELLLFE